MSIQVDKWLTKQFQPGRNGYNCFAFAREVWQALGKADLGEQTPEVRCPNAYQEAAFQKTRELIKLEKPEDPCLVLFLRSGAEPHIGVYYKGKVLHLNEKGAYYMPLEQVRRGFSSVGYYR